MTPQHSPSLMNAGPPDAPPTFLGRPPICSSAHLEGGKTSFAQACVGRVRRRHASLSLGLLGWSVRRPVELADVAHDPRGEMVKPLVD